MNDASYMKSMYTRRLWKSLTGGSEIYWKSSVWDSMMVDTASHPIGCV